MPLRDLQGNVPVETVLDKKDFHIQSLANDFTSPMAESLELRNSDIGQNLGVQISFNDISVEAKPIKLADQANEAELMD